MTDTDVTGAHLRMLAEKAEDRIERARAAEDIAKRHARHKDKPKPPPRWEA